MFDLGTTLGFKKPESEVVVSIGAEYAAWAMLDPQFCNEDLPEGSLLIRRTAWVPLGYVGRV